ncbi:MAG: hypothetical protein PQJ46_07880, partial [Spirochaetales bacterium]|nr:hypothetical protein [Spirochaetales bacterium]
SIPDKEKSTNYAMDAVKLLRKLDINEPYLKDYFNIAISILQENGVDLDSLFSIRPKGEN